MKDLILFGAYDRFNFGDLLMPMAIARWIERHRPDLLEHYRLRFASLTASDLSGRGGVPSEAILDVCASAPSGSVLIVAGGEVVGAKRAGLYMHNSRDDSEHRAKRRLRQRDPEAFETQLVAELGDLWEYPYLPPAGCLPAGGRVFLNAIGGSLSAEEVPPEDLRWSRLAQADYVSVRDQRLVAALTARGIAVHPVPCAVGMIAAGLFSDLDAGPPPVPDPYFVVQCVHNPREINPEALAGQIRALAEASGLRPWLVPLATASGHSDHKMLELVHGHLGDLAGIDRENSVSSILTAFRHARFYTGTSLHGTITAMAYAIPYYPFKKSIRKIGAYLGAWSSADLTSLNHVRTPGQIARIPWDERAALAAPLQANALRLADLAAANMTRMIALLEGQSSGHRSYRVATRRQSE